MNSRERVRAVLRREIPDRVPMDLWGTDSRMNTEFYEIAAKYLGYTELGERIRPAAGGDFHGGFPEEGYSLHRCRTGICGRKYHCKAESQASRLQRD